MADDELAGEGDGLAEALRAVGLDPTAVRAVEPLPGGLSGARLWRLTLAQPVPGGAGEAGLAPTVVSAATAEGEAGLAPTGGAVVRRSYVLKRLLPAHGWLGAASRDTRLREVTLWASGLLSDLPRGIETATVRWALAGPPERPEWGALLLRDERAHLLPDPLRAPPGTLPPMVAALLDALARMHARFWDDPRLDDPALGLTPPDAALLLTSPDSVRAALAAGDANPYLPLATAGWEAFFRLAPPDAAETLRGVLAAPGRWVAAIERLPRTLVHGDVWGPNLGWLLPTTSAPRTGPRLLLLDWALATAGPATYDPLWLCGTWHALDPVRVLALYRARLTRHLAARGVLLSPAVWLALADAGYLRTALTCGEALGRAAAEAPPGAMRLAAEARVRWWAERAARAAERQGIQE